ncbi:MULTISPECIES: flagellar hook-associated protein FlgK [unclassified Fusibacter]|uniref:flagellar hook-associated protein FlgK n=1 Tax=unclassified Fusibacter TaxID=2624464 RepID=UPI001013AC7D|nr:MULTISPECIES: flagellar hook-associated protein FlgK [unclassified Fusibacter]MCK8059839.1 flagellar hook-associated protein FlgK [Fusibacter sp. A2]NPE21641.1 flagellar hook-associated protein FlgK [Fusibacter sp. A1]RXV62045.1 flagellar hook-associated protein FlgK [Fusibacter sp. A1]
MSSTFFGLNIAKSGLFASQKALNVVSHNIANANTEGYSRQRVTMKADRPDELPGIQGSLGTGVDTEQIIQIRDEFLDFKFRGESEKLGEWEARMDGMETIESIFNEPSDSGIRELMDQFYSSLHELNKNPESLTTRALVRQRAIALTGGLNSMSESLKKFQKDTDFNVQVTATQVNSYAQQIVDLNRVIYNSELSGGTANDLRDQRNLLVDKLSELIDIDYFEDDMGRFFINASGTALVSHYRYDELITVTRTELLNEGDAPYLNDIAWKSGSTFIRNGGKLKALLDLQSNASGDSKGVPYYIEKLNEFADTMTNELNRIHSSGFALSGDSGINLFTIDGMSTDEYNDYLLQFGLNGGNAIDVTDSVIVGVSEDNTETENDLIVVRNMSAVLKNTAGYEKKSIKYIDGRYYITDRMDTTSLTISKEVDEDLDSLATAEYQEGLPGDGTNALRLAESRHNVELFAWGSPDDFVKSLVANLGVDTQEAIRMSDNTSNLRTQIDINRQSIAGVSLDEEMSEMIKFQHTYNASARLMTTIDSMLDTIINRLGLVGR